MPIWAFNNIGSTPTNELRSHNFLASFIALVSQMQTQKHILLYITLINTFPRSRIFVTGKPYFAREQDVLINSIIWELSYVPIKVPIVKTSTLSTEKGVNPWSVLPAFQGIQVLTQGFTNDERQIYNKGKDESFDDWTFLRLIWYINPGTTVALTLIWFSFVLFASDFHLDVYFCQL